MFESRLTTFICGISSKKLEPLIQIGVLLPTRGRYEPLFHTLLSLVGSNYSHLLEVIVVCDADMASYEVANNFHSAEYFASYTVYLSRERLYPVSAFNVAYNLCSSEIFTWMNDENTYNRDWLKNALVRFMDEFPDGVGVLSLYKKKKAGLGMSTKRFVEYNNHEFFHDGYTVYFPDDELTCRAILLGRYAWIEQSGIMHDLTITESIPVIPPDEKIAWKKTDRGIYYARSETNYGLNPEKLYPWPGFKEVNLPLRENK